MADIGPITPVGDQINVPQPGAGLNAYSTLLGIQQQKQQLQIGQQTLASGQADVQQKQQQMHERQILQQALQTGVDDQGNSIKGADGEIDPQAMSAFAARALPLTGQQVVQNVLKTQSDRIGVYKAALALNTDQREAIGKVVRGAVGSNMSSDQIVDQANQAVGDNAQGRASVAAMQPLLKHLDKIPPGQQRDEALTHLAEPYMTPDELRQLQESKPQPVQGRQGINLVEGNRYAAGGAGAQLNAQPIGQGQAPGSVIVKDAYENQFVYNPQDRSLVPIDKAGGRSPTPPQPPQSPQAPQSAAPATSRPPGFQQPVAGQSQVLEEVERARSTGDQGPSVRNVNGQLLSLSEQTRTGPGSEAVQKLAAAAGLKSGSRYQEITAYLDRQAALSARTMGVPNTNAGLAASQSATGTTGYTPQALQEKVKFADALNSGSMAYRQGLDKAIGTGPTPDLTKYQAFRSAWTRNFDPDVYRFEDAQRRGDKSEIAAISKREGPQGMRDLAAKSANLRRLENGEIPSG